MDAEYNTSVRELKMIADITKVGAENQMLYMDEK